MPQRGRRTGFTLLEVLIALMIGAIVLAAARGLLVQIADGADATARAARADDLSANTDQEMRALFAQVELGDSPDRQFNGDERSVTFSSWCAMPAGWMERCRVSVLLAPSGPEAIDLVAHLSTGDTLMVPMNARSGTFIYLSDPHQERRWFRSWERGSVAPWAVGVVAGGDTTILRIGERG
jgi:prepilin-type N-terminal cleavage/methylation domain-containing protein